MFTILLILASINFESSNGAMEFNFHQNMYDLVMERAEGISNNPEVSENFAVKSFKTRSEGILINFTITYFRDLEDIKINIKILQLFSNVYRPTNMNFVVSWCDCLKYDYVGLQSAKTTQGNFTNCPLLKNTYLLFNYKMDSTRLPPLIPEGKYKLIFELFESKTNTPLFSMACFGNIVYKVAKG